MKNEQSRGIRSAYELAMERLEQRDGKLAVLTPKQKQALAEIDRKLQARLAEVEILAQKDLADLLAAQPAEDQSEKIRRREEQKTADLARIRAEAEAEKERVRRGS